MKLLTLQEANQYLGGIGMEIGDWNQITDIASRQLGKCHWKNYCAPKDRLLNFSQHVAGWLPKGDWKIFQIDNSTGWMDPVQVSLFGGLLFGADNIPDLNQTDNRTFLFEFGKNGNVDKDTELLIANLIYVFLLFESHGYVVSSNSNLGQRLGIQDGVVCFSLGNKNMPEVEALLDNFERNPLTLPQWVSEICAERQPALPR
jgi:hypothetical protein